MPDRAAFVRPASKARWRRRAWLLAIGEVPVLVLAGTLLVGLRPVSSPDPGADPGRVTARIDSCGLGSSAAEIAYTVTNQDRTGHGYRVELTVMTATSALGSGTSLLPGVPAGATVTGRALIPLHGDLTGATCRARAVAFDGVVGHH